MRICRGGTGQLAARVVTIELIPALADLARENLRRTGRGGNVLVIAGDGCLGYADWRPTTLFRWPPPHRKSPLRWCGNCAIPAAW